MITRRSAIILGIASLSLPIAWVSNRSPVQKGRQLIGKTFGRAFVRTKAYKEFEQSFEDALTSGQSVITIPLALKKDSKDAAAHGATELYMLNIFARSSNVSQITAPEELEFYGLFNAFVGDCGNQLGALALYT